MGDSKGLKIEAVDQIGYVVRDAEETAKRYWKELGIGPWAIMTVGPGVPHKIFGKDTSVTCVKIAVAQLGPVSLELVQPINDAAVHQNFLDEHGEGLHHLGVFVPSVEEAGEIMRKLGYEEILSCSNLTPNGGGAAKYFDTRSSMGTLLEFIEPPSEMPVAKIYPGPGD